MTGGIVSPKLDKSEIFLSIRITSPKLDLSCSFPDDERGSDGGIEKSTYSYQISARDFLPMSLTPLILIWRYIRDKPLSRKYWSGNQDANQTERSMETVLYTAVFLLEAQL